MKRLGYTRYVAQGGDWGSPVSNAMARQAPAGLLGIHLNLPATCRPRWPWCSPRRARAGGLTDEERATSTRSAPRHSGELGPTLR